LDSDGVAMKTKKASKRKVLELTKEEAMPKKLVIEPVPKEFTE